MSDHFSLAGAFFLTSSLTMVVSGPRLQGAPPTPPPTCTSQQGSTTTLPPPAPPQQPARNSSLSCPGLQVFDPALGVCVCGPQVVATCNSLQRLNQDICRCECVRVVALGTATTQGMTKRSSRVMASLLAGSKSHRKLHAHIHASRAHSNIAGRSPGATRPPGTKPKPPGSKPPPATKADPRPCFRAGPLGCPPSTPAPPTLPIPTTAPPTTTTVLQCPLGQVLNLNDCQCNVV
eukprot:Em0015g824a